MKSERACALQKMRRASWDLVALMLPAILLSGSGTLWAAVNAWTSLGPQGGAIRALAIDPKNSGTVYAVTGDGRVFKSADGGVSWNPMNSVLPSVNPLVAALIIDPQNPSTLYALTGGYGVFRTTNGGANWSAANDGLPGFIPGVPAPGTPVASLVIDPQNPSTVYAGMRFGVFKSTDRGASWIAANSGLPSDTFVIALAIDPQSPNTLYAESGVSSGPSRFGVFKSTDGGATWSAANSGLPVNDFVNVLAIDPQSPKTVYASVAGLGVFKSRNGALSWSAVNSGLTTLSVNALTIDPGNPDTLYTGTTSRMMKNRV